MIAFTKLVPDDNSPWWERVYDAADPRVKLAKAGWTKEQIEWIAEHREFYRDRDGTIYLTERRRLEFARWMVERGKLTEFPDDS